MPTTVIADANGLIMPFQFRMNIELELERLLGSFKIVVPSNVFKELERLSKSNREARKALRLAKKYERVEALGKVDDAILHLALMMKAAVLTNDKELLVRLREAGVPRLRMRSKTHLVLEGSL